MILPIYAYGEPALRSETIEIQRSFPHLEDIIKNMWDTMYHTNGVGLAAPQVGISIRLFVVDSTEMYKEEDEDPSKGIKKVFINPSIINESGQEWEYEEGCLSIPGIREFVSRKSNIKIRYYDEHFDTHTDEYDGLTARVIQHEFDHLEAILFVDKISSLKRQLNRNKLLQISRGFVDVKYRMKFARR
ncbi:MAG: peptide deformylase [Bacteroidota bacterium]|nr:peptide deformylase [Bacteroidota bacterium]